MSDTAGGPAGETMEPAAKRRCESHQPFDIGRFAGLMENASNDDIKSLLDNVWKPSNRMDCPSTSGRRFQLSWIETYPWLAYSKEVDGAFCIWCVIFGHRFQALSKNSSKLEQLYREPFRSWGKASSKLQMHNTKSHVHKFAALEYDNFLQLIENVRKPVEQMISANHTTHLGAMCNYDIIQ